MTLHALDDVSRELDDLIEIEVRAAVLGEPRLEHVGAAISDRLASAGLTATLDLAGHPDRLIDVVVKRPVHGS